MTSISCEFCKGNREKIYKNHKLKMSDESTDATEPYSSSFSESDEVLTITSSSSEAPTVDYDTVSQSDQMETSQSSSQGQSQQQAMNNEPLEGQVFEVPLVNVVQEAVVISRSQEQQNAQINRSRETTPLSCSPNDDQLKPIKTSSKKRKR